MKRVVLLSLLLLAACQLGAQAQTLLTLNGARLAQGQLEVDWSLLYQGPDAEITLLEPSLTRSTFGQTSLQVEAWSTKGRHVGTFESPYLAGRYASHKDWFIQLKRCQAVSGTFKVPLGQVNFTPPAGSSGELQELKLRIIHAPWDDGQRHDLKAWKGEIASPWINVLKEGSRSLDDGPES